MDTSLAVELWSARVRWRQGFIDEVEVLAPTPAQGPVRIGAARSSEDALVVGRHAGDTVGDHLAWTAETGEEDLQLSRTQLRFTRSGHHWRVAVPGPAGSRRSATLRYWASGRSRTLEAGGVGVVLEPDANVCLAVTTDSTCYWALVRTPREDPPEDPPTPRGAGHSDTTEKPSGVDTKLPSFPEGWREAVEVKFRPFLTWPMDIDPGLVKPSNYIDPRTGRGTDVGYQERVRKRLNATQAAAAARGFVPPAQPNALEIRLLEWLVNQKMITFESDRLTWVGPPAPSGPRLRRPVTREDP